jgi:hypothetical protein
MCVCVCYCVFYVLIKNLFAISNCTMFKSTFDIRVVIIFRGMPLWSWFWLGRVVKLVTVGALQYQFLR